MSQVDPENVSLVKQKLSLGNIPQGVDYSDLEIALKSFCKIFQLDILQNSQNKYMKQGTLVASFQSNQKLQQLLSSELLFFDHLLEIRWENNSKKTKISETPDDDRKLVVTKL